MESRPSALARLDDVFHAVRDLPFECDWYAGDLKIGDRCFEVPPRWLATDPGGFHFPGVVQDAWHAVLTRPISTGRENGVLCLRIWQLVLRYESGAVREWPARMHGGVTTMSSQNAGDGQPLMHFPGIYASDIPVFLAHALNAAIVRLALRSGAPLTIEPDFGQALADYAAAEIRARIRDSQIRDLLEELVAGSEERLALIQKLSINRIDLRGWLTTFLNGDIALEHWPARDKNLQAFLPLLLCHGEEPTPDGALRWLRANGLSRKGSVRLRHLPLAVTCALVRQWLAQAPTDFRACVEWLNIFLAEIDRQRQHVQDLHADGAPNPATNDIAWHAAAQLAGAAGVIAACRANPLPPATTPTRVWQWLDGLRFGKHPSFGDEIRTAVHAAWQRFDENPFEEGSRMNAQSPATYLFRMAEAALRDARGDAPVDQCRDERVVKIHDRFALLCLRALLVTGTRPERLMEPAQFAMDWINGNIATLRPDDLGNDWQTLQRRQQRWHDGQLGHAGIPGTDLNEFFRNESWNDHVAAFTHEDFLVVPLTNGEALIDEGDALRHCVASYAPPCIAGASRLYSIRQVNDGVRIGTAEFRATGSRWELVQFRGLRNENFIAINGPDADRPLPRFRGVMWELRKRINSPPVVPALPAAEPVLRPVLGPVPDFPPPPDFDIAPSDTGCRAQPND